MEKENVDIEMSISLEDEIFSDLKTELQFSETFNETLLLSKVKNALREVKSKKKYPSYYTEEQIQRDMYNYFSNIRNIALYDYNQIGAEYESSHSENSISRAFIDRNSLFAGIIAISQI